MKCGDVTMTCDDVVTSSKIVYEIMTCDDTVRSQLVIIQCHETSSSHAKFLRIFRGFFGEIETSDAEKLLNGKKKGTYLIRFSTRDPGCYAITVLSKV